MPGDPYIWMLEQETGIDIDGDGITSFPALTAGAARQIRAHPRRMRGFLARSVRCTDFPSGSARGGAASTCPRESPPAGFTRRKEHRRGDGVSGPGLDTCLASRGRVLSFYVARSPDL
jgi:hypothetical protein